MSIKSILENQAQLLIDQDSLIEELYGKLQSILKHPEDKKCEEVDACKEINSELGNLIEIKSDVISKNNRYLKDLIERIDL